MNVHIEGERGKSGLKRLLMPEGKVNVAWKQTERTSEIESGSGDIVK